MSWKKLNSTGICRVSLAFVVTLTLMLGSLQAYAMSTTLAQGESATFDFDFPAVDNTVATPIEKLTFDTVYSGFTSGEQGQIDFYSGLGGTGSLYTSVVVAGPNTGDTVTIIHPIGSGLEDAVFSTKITANLGSFDITSVAARIIDMTGDPYTIRYPQAAAVPEPDTVVLMGLGLVGLGYAGRRKLVSQPT